MVEGNPQKEYIDKLRELKQAYQNVFESESGKKVLADLERRCFYNTTTFSQNSNTTIFNEGKRSVLLHIKNMALIDLEATAKALKEQQKAQEDKDNAE